MSISLHGCIIWFNLTQSEQEVTCDNSMKLDLVLSLFLNVGLRHFMNAFFGYSHPHEARHHLFFSSGSNHALFTWQRGLSDEWRHPINPQLRAPLWSISSLSFNSEKSDCSNDLIVWICENKNSYELTLGHPRPCYQEKKKTLSTLLCYSVTQ